MPQARGLLFHGISSYLADRLRPVIQETGLTAYHVIRQNAWYLARAWPGAVRVRPLRCSKADARPLSHPGVSWPSLVQGQLLSDGREQFPHVLGGLGGGLEEQKSGLAGVCFGLGGRDGPLVGLLGDEIQLVTGQGDDDVLVGLALELLDPRLCLIQGRLRPGRQRLLRSWLGGGG